MPLPRVNELAAPSASGAALLAALLLAGCGGDAGEAAGGGGRPAREAGSCTAGPIFVDAAAEAGLDFTHWSGRTGEHYLPEITGSGVALLDYDRDGDLDVYLVQGNLLDPRETAADALTPPPGELPLGDRLFRNDAAGGALRFTDVTAESGIVAAGYGMGAAVGDVDNDGWPDLYLTNLGPNQLWRNQGDGTFRDATAEARVDVGGWSVPAVFLDYDRDGWLDLYVGNYLEFNVGSHRQCHTATGAPDYCGPLSYRPATDRLFRNRGDGTFADVTRSAGLADAAGNSLGALAADFDGDGWLDLYVANDGTENFLWRNRGDGTFVEQGLYAGVAVSAEGQPQASMGVDAADFDEDGDLDLFLTHLSDETNTLYRNDGDGGFVDTSVPSGVGMAGWANTGFGTAWIDFDHDGRLDLLAVNGAVRKIPAQMQAGRSYPLEQPKQLLRNLGEGRFEDATALGGPVLAVPEVSRGAAFGDLDGDGDTDVVINNSNGPARLLVNECAQGRDWIGFEVVDRHGRPALGATVTLELEGGGRMLRRVATDGSYASANDPRARFGLHGRPRPTGVVVGWATGGTARFAAGEIGRYHRLVEAAAGQVAR